MKRDLVVVGASSGGVAALRRLVARLPAHLPAAVLVVQHIGSHMSLLPRILASSGDLPASHATNGESIRTGRIVVAPPDHHLLVEDHTLRLTRSAREHFTRPAIDPLFRSAAVSAGSRVIGVLLTGLLDDGSAGLKAIKDCGGLALVQDPSEAEEPEMIRYAMRNVKVDAVLPIDRLADEIVRLTAEPVRVVEVPVPEPLERELALSMEEGDPMEHLEAIGQLSGLVCPECNGAMWQIRDGKLLRFRCHTGHAFGLATLAQAQASAVEEALWSALRALQEKGILARKVADLDRESGDDARAAASEAQAQRLDRQVETLRDYIQDIGSEPAGAS